MFDHFAFLLKEMGFILASLLVNSLVILSAFQVRGSAGFNLRSLEATASIFSHKIGAKIRARVALLHDDPSFDPTSFPTVIHLKTQGTHAVAPQSNTFHDPLRIYHPPTKAPYQLEHLNEPSRNHLGKPVKNPASSQSASFFRNLWRRNRTGKFSPQRYDQQPPPNLSWQGESPSISPSLPPFPLSVGTNSPVPVPSPIPADHFSVPQPIISPASSSPKRVPSPSPILVLPPPPPNQDCTSLLCSEPLTYAPSGSPCGCVWPIQVGLRLSVSVYTFFPLLSELAKEISTSLGLNRSQVRIMGANAANQQLEKTGVLINLVPLDERFNASTAFSIYRKFWKREVFIQASHFGRYEVVYVRYPGLPPSPPSLPTATATISDRPNPGTDSDGRAVKPLGVDVPRRRKNAIGRNIVIVIVLSSITTFVVCIGFVWFLLLKCGYFTSLPQQNPHVLIVSNGKTSGACGTGPLILKSRPSSTSMSFSSSILAYTGTAKVFSLNDIERATNRFDTSRIIGEGGFGIVYSGILDDATKVAVKVLKRDDQQGSREFLAEVEMLSRLHHRNLVKLIGICTESHHRSLIYELVPNGSVESHLHGADKEASPLDWHSRMKIALGAARGLAYLHEDSSPRVIHRDFKSSNILLQHDFTPKVSDFGLARIAQEERNKHISTHVMGTFGYLAPEYAMTGHLLVKSDVYSYGVVLLELLTGRKPVDLSQPPGQENLVAWARPLLTTKEGLEMIIDPALIPSISFDNAAKFAAIASMCVQPEVSHRPFMGEVVQALKLVCNEFDETRDLMSRSCSQEEFSIDMDSKNDSRNSGEVGEASNANYPDFDSTFDHKIALSTTNLASEGIVGLESESFRRQFNSAPLKLGRKRRFWERLKGLSRGSMSEHGYTSVFHQ